jgi:hypothetical protein
MVRGIIITYVILIMAHISIVSRKRNAQNGFLSPYPTLLENHSPNTCYSSHVTQWIKQPSQYVQLVLVEFLCLCSFKSRKRNAQNGFLSPYPTLLENHSPNTCYSSHLTQWIKQPLQYIQLVLVEFLYSCSFKSRKRNAQNKFLSFYPTLPSSKTTA